MGFGNGTAGSCSVCGRGNRCRLDGLRRTAGGERHRPDGCLQLAQLFRAERSGDLLVSAREGFDLRARWEIPEHHSTHGALIPSQMYVPVIISHPVAADHFRTVDVFPTVLQLMGRQAGEGIDGIVLASGQSGEEPDRN